MINFDYALGLVLSVLALVYLGYAMLRPEKF
jgi:K+-transporting ATPase KdpF subunit